MNGTYEFYFAQPWWLLACVLLVPMIWLARQSLTTLGKTRRVLAQTLRVLVVIILALVLARPTLGKKSEKLTVIAVMDRSLSIPEDLQNSARGQLVSALANKPPADQFAVVDVAELASIEKLPATEVVIYERNTTLTGEQSDLARGVQMAMAIAPPDTGSRILLVSDGNETEGDLREAARLAGANRIPIDVLPLQYSHKREVVFKRLVGPNKARSGQTVTLRFILSSTGPARGKLLLKLNGRLVDLDPDSPALGVPVQLRTGTNVKTVSMPLGSKGLHEFEAAFVPDNAEQDKISQNNMASAITYVAGPGHVLVLDSGDGSGQAIVRALLESDMTVRHSPVQDLPLSLVGLMDTDAIILANTASSHFTFQQQEMLCRYVKDLGGGLAMIGGPDSFGAGGWIGSPLAEILPIDLDPPQKKQMPKGALVLIMHACEMPRGNYWGKTVAIVAVRSLSRLDLAGVLDYGWTGGQANWVYPLSPVGDKTAVVSAIRKMQMGDMPDFGAPMTAAYKALKDCNAGQKHIIIISDGDPQMPSNKLLGQLRQAGITCSGVVVFPHDPQFVQSLATIAKATGGRFYNVKDPQALPQIFIKEAQVVRRNLIIEETFSPRITYSLSEILKGLTSGLPALDGYVLTGPKGGLAQVVLRSAQDDPILATAQAGLGRCLAFTSSTDSRWASNWIVWGGFARFWEQAIRWVGRPSMKSDCEIFTDVHGQEVTVTVEGLDQADDFVQFSDIVGQIISPDFKAEPLELTQIGPGRYRGNFHAPGSGSYMVNLRYRKAGPDATTGLAQTAVTVPYAPEFRDLSDNSALLAEVAQASGGRIIKGDLSQVNFFQRSGLAFPESAYTLTKPLFLIWLGLFLLDVAVRRIALDFKSMARKLTSLFRMPARAQLGKTLTRLQQRRRELARQLSRKPKEPLASKKYEATPEKVADLPVADTAPQIRPSSAKPSAKPAAQPQREQTHLERLLKAKRQATDHTPSPRNDPNSGDKQNG